MEEIKILAINTSPRKGRNTQQLAEAVLDGCRSLDAQAPEVGATEMDGAGGLKITTEMIQAGDAPADGFQLCRGCWSCVKKAAVF